MRSGLPVLLALALAFSGALAAPQLAERGAARTLVAQCSECPDDIDVFCEPDVGGRVACVRYADNLRSLYRRYAGDVNDVCGPSNTCNSASAICSGGFCVACGGNGEPCCASSTCSTNHYCYGGTQCNPCGALGQICCPTLDPLLRCHGDGVACNWNNNACMACGTIPNGPCCSDNTCSSIGTQCVGTVCLECGRVGKPCCSSGSPCPTSGTCNGFAQCV